MSWLPVKGHCGRRIRGEKKIPSDHPGNRTFLEKCCKLTCMEVVAALIGFGIFFSPLIAVLVLGKKLKNMEHRLERLNERLSRLEPGEEELSPPAGGFFQDFPDFKEELQQEKNRVEEEKTALSVSFSRSSVQNIPPGKSHLFSVMKKLEKQFLDNWTGILGAVIFVLGAGFLSIYAALKMKEFARFLLLLFFSAIPAGLFFYLKEKEQWKRQASWFRSISGAVFLFACLGSGGIPGLQWIHNPFQSLGLLILGIGVNLGLSSLGGKQFFASFHTLLSLTALAVIPPGTPSLFMAAVICLYGIIQTYRERWDLHLFLTITGFFAYHLYWMLMLQQSGFSEILRYQGAGAVTLVFLAAAFIHYRKNYAAGTFELIPFLVYLSNWFYFITGIVLYAGEYPWRTVPLLAAGLLALILAGKAEKKGISWLRTSDYMLMQALFVSALLTLKGWDLPDMMVWGILYMEILLFAFMMVRQKSLLLCRAALNLGYAAAAVLAVKALDANGREFSAAVIPALTAFLALWLHRTLWESENQLLIREDTLPGLKKVKKEFSLTGFSAGIMGTAAFGALRLADCPPVLDFPLGMLLVSFMTGARRKSPSRGITAGTVILLSAFVFDGWDSLAGSGDPLIHFSTGASLLAAAGFSLTSMKKDRKWFSFEGYGLLLFTGSLLFASFALLNPLSDILPGIFWLSLSFLAGNIKKYHRLFQRTGTLILGVYLVRHFLLQRDILINISGLPVRYLLDFITLGLILFWYHQRSETSDRKAEGRYALFLEGAVLFVTSILLMDISFLWISGSLGFLALVLLISGHFSGENGRLRFYSLIIYWAAVTVLMVSVIRRLDDPLFPVSGAVAMVMLILYLTGIYLLGNLSDIPVPDNLILIKKASRAAARRIHALVLYPAILAGAFFILAAAGSQSRTFFWALECFLIYGASLFLREEHFRYVSQGGLFLCVLRLLLVDMSGSTVFIRGLVFLGVGILMLGVNILYNRFKNRFAETGNEITKK